MAITNKLKDVADAIRRKTGKDTTMTLAEMPREIDSIPLTGENLFINGSREMEIALKEDVKKGDLLGIENINKVNNFKPMGPFEEGTYPIQIDSSYFKSNSSFYVSKDRKKVFIFSSYTSGSHTWRYYWNCYNIENNNIVEKMSSSFADTVDEDRFAAFTPYGYNRVSPNGKYVTNGSNANCFSKIVAIVEQEDASYIPKKISFEDPEVKYGFTDPRDDETILYYKKGSFYISKINYETLTIPIGQLVGIVNVPPDTSSRYGWAFLDDTKLRYVMNNDGYYKIAEYNRVSSNELKYLQEIENSKYETNLYTFMFESRVNKKEYVGYDDNNFYLEHLIGDSFVKLTDKDFIFCSKKNVPYLFHRTKAISEINNFYINENFSFGTFRGEYSDNYIFKKVILSKDDSDYYFYKANGANNKKTIADIKDPTSPIILFEVLGTVSEVLGYSQADYLIFPVNSPHGNIYGGYDINSSDMNLFEFENVSTGIYGKKIGNNSFNDIAVAMDNGKKGSKIKALNIIYPNK